MKPDVGKIVNGVVDNMTRGRCIPTDSMKIGDNYSNLHNFGNGDYIELDKTNQHIWLVHVIPYWIEISESKETRFILI